MPTMSASSPSTPRIASAYCASVEYDRLCACLRDARLLASKPDPGRALGAVVSPLPDAIRRITNDAAAPHRYVFEVLWALVELTAAALAHWQPELTRLLEALAAGFDPTSTFFQQRRARPRELAVCAWRVEAAVQVPGFFVRSGEDVVHYLCAKRGVNTLGEGCECCKPPPEADAALVSLTWLLAMERGYDHILRALGRPRALDSLPAVELLLRPFVLLLERNVGSKTWRRIMDFTEGGFNTRAGGGKTEFRNVCFNMCSEVYRYLDELARAKEFNPCPNFDTQCAAQWTFSDVLRHVHAVTSWGVTYYAGSVAFESIRTSVCTLQEKMWECLLESKRFSMACASIGAAIDASPSLGSPMLSPEWLKEKKVVLKLLNVRYEMKNVPKVLEFVKVLARKKGIVVVEQKDFVSVMKNAGTRSSNPHLTILDTDADDLIVATMLESLDLSAYAPDFFEYTLKWLEDCQPTSAISGSRIFHVLSKLFVYDRNKKWEKRFLNLLWKHAIGISDAELVECFSNVVDHYTSDTEIESLLKTLPTSEEQSKLLQDCNNADSIACISDDVCSSLNHTKLYGQIAKHWEEKEAMLHLSTSSNFANALAIGIPHARCDTTNECLKRLALAQQLTGVLTTDHGSGTLASAMTTALIPEFQALEALKKESVLHCEVVRQIQELSEKHVREYENMRREHHERLVKFFQTCRKEKEDVISEALYQKAKVMASAKKVMLHRDVKLSDSQDILTRMLQKAEDVFKERMESLERVPSDECAVCMTEFSAKRKRACLDPCGHASACVECATHEWKRTKSCLLCKSNIEKPIVVPYKLFF